MERNDVETINKKIDDLAQMVARGFDQTATKDELISLKGELKGELASVEERLSAKIDGLGRRMDNELDKRVSLEHDLQEVKKHVGLSV